MVEGPVIEELKHARAEEARGDREGWSTATHSARPPAPAARTGRRLARNSILAKLETAVGRRLRPLPRGRPRKRE